MSEEIVPRASPAAGVVRYSDSLYEAFRRVRGICRLLGACLIASAVVSACAGPDGPGARDISGATGASDVRSALDVNPAPWPDAVPIADTLTPGIASASVLRGRAILAATRDSLPEFVGNSLRCTTCHLDDGRRQNALPWVGVIARFPQYRSRNAIINFIEDRVNDCFERSLAGSALPHDSEAMRDIVAYFRFLSHGVRPGVRIAGQGAPAVSVTSGDVARGRDVYAQNCARCHGMNGEGTALATPLWGDESYSNGAGMGRPRTAAAFIRANMPYDSPTLSEQQALDVATYINAQARPVFERGHADWPFGGAPADVPYATHGRAAGR